MEERKEDYRNRWQRENQERIIVMVKKKEKQKYQEAATASGQSLNAWIIAAMEEKRDKERT